jgi:hypothetical protein
MKRNEKVSQKQDEKKLKKREHPPYPTVPGVSQEMFDLIVQAAKNRRAELEYLKDR